MELSQLGFLEELLAPRKDTWNTLSTGLNELLLPNGWTFDSFDENLLINPSLNPSFASFSTPLDHRFECPYGTDASSLSYPYLDGFSVPEFDDSAPVLPQQESIEEFGFVGSENKRFEESKISCKVEEQVSETPVFNMGLCGEKKAKSKRVEGQPSKNLMAERRRRKRLNDRLSMLRSIVPKISKMDRTSILGDTIDYMKELLERISKLQEEIEKEGTNQINLLGISKELKPNEVMVRNSPKFDVERRDQDTRISICCATKPGLLLSTVNTLEALGLEIHQCVISSFNDFSLQASCSEVAGQRNCMNPEEIKQSLFRNAGYGGRCL
ncbi:putative transcription factor bHLH family [Medicago truncatula]|uniref:BHLH transcription factor n=1 Tax=Medicago truncatula TaxID=3880 RepID=A9YWR2_MEDTR|nr:transcription factor bHLH93 isoform X1 [Medicago truncatula]ABY48134.1 bHLH transcription factor [Medicago truncatula]AES95896.1 transcription factor bHLH93 [Medicago truncatula]RHN54867.1 putative transcription factor bHLH family [Medicago truncatula]